MMYDIIAFENLSFRLSTHVYEVGVLKKSPLWGPFRKPAFLVP